MKALTLTQPYATLVAEGVKRWETRSWSTSYRGPLVIHAASSYSGIGRRKALAVIDELPRLTRELLDLMWGNDYPLGALLAVTSLEAVERTEDVRPLLRPEEITVGDYTPGRYAWKLREPVAFAPVACKGHQRMWNVDDRLIPDYAIEAIRHPGVA